MLLFNRETEIDFSEQMGKRTGKSLHQRKQDL